MRVHLLVFDVNETLSDMTPIASTFRQIGLSEHDATTWFAGVLRDGFAATAAGAPVAFGDCAVGTLTSLLDAAGRPEDARSDDVATVLAAMRDLDAHPDVAPGLAALTALGLRLVTLTNGAVAMTEAMFDRAGVLDLFEHRLSVDAVGPWKPAPAPYAYALEVCDVGPGEAALVAVHPWDVHGAQRAGLAGVWVNRAGARYPSYLPPPDLTVASLEELAAVVGDWSPTRPGRVSP